MQHGHYQHYATREDLMVTVNALNMSFEQESQL
jgi:hypothetical protein